MDRVVYADILLIVNMYVNYALLRITSVIIKRKASALRVVLSSFLGGIYSFIILLQNIPSFLLYSSRLLLSALMVIVAFGFVSKKVFMRTFVVFMISVFSFAGIMFALWTFFAPEVMAYRNTVVYFNIDTFDLCVMTVICYGFLKLFDLLIRNNNPENTIYDITVCLSEREFKTKAFLDTGNRLTEHFSGYPVIVTDRFLADTDGISISDYFSQSCIIKRFVSCESVSGETVLEAVRPDKVKIKGIEIYFETDKVYIALSERKIKGGDFGALLPGSLFKGKTKENEKDYRRISV